MDPSILLNNPKLSSISPEKLNFLLDFAKKNENRTPKEMLPLFLAASSSARKQGLDFSSSETSLILELMKQNMTEEEKRKVDMIVNMVQKRQNLT